MDRPHAQCALLDTSPTPKLPPPVCHAVKVTSPIHTPPLLVNPALLAISTLLLELVYAHNVSQANTLFKLRLCALNVLQGSSPTQMLHRPVLNVPRDTFLTIREVQSAFCVTARRLQLVQESPCARVVLLDFTVFQ
eukprot:TRINITY_DN72276_c0_g1_i1.p2 TRINITY_DN72276_c0_g1~~TRINITY_DN72276_c0_g1_i1.p2  ORF type:complete len:136 (+),score=15.99 TRINITY_DN72276_c0_g1_i1:228-635(+)